MKKKNGSLIITATVFFTFIFIMIIVFYYVMLAQIHEENEMVRSDMVASEHAAIKQIDLSTVSGNKELDQIKITNCDDAYERFKYYLKMNLNLDDNFMPKSQYNFIKGKVKIKRFIIYNLNKNDLSVEVCTLNSEGNFEKRIVKNGNVSTPKGNYIQHTTIHACIDFNVATYKFGKFTGTQEVSPSEDVDITEE